MNSLALGWLLDEAFEGTFGFAGLPIAAFAAKGV